MELCDDNDGKPIGIQMHIGRRPLIAFGNSDGDFQMLEWTITGNGSQLGGYKRYTDDKLEWAYD